MKVHAFRPALSGSKPRRSKDADTDCHGGSRFLPTPAGPIGSPTYAWAIECSEGVIVSMAGRAHLLESGKSLHPYVRWEVAFRIEPEQEIGPQLRALGVGPRDVKRVVLTHLHMDHDGGLAHFPNSEILVASGELKIASGLAGRMRGYLPHRWPSWFDPAPLQLEAISFDPSRSDPSRKAGG